MHQILRTPELFSLIFHFLNAYDLVHCALTCRLWHAEALALQWKVGPVRLVSVMKKLTRVRLDPGGARYIQVRYARKSAPSVYVPERIVLEQPSGRVSRALWEAFLAWTARVRVLDMTEDHLSPKSLSMLHKLVKRYGGTIFPAVHTVINLSPSRSMGTLQLIASPVVTHVEITDRLDENTRWSDQSNDLLDFMGRTTPNLRLLTLHGLHDIDISPFQYLRDFRYHTDSFKAETWVDLSGCPLLESVWLSFGWDEWDISSAADLQPVTFPALRLLTLAARNQEDLMALAKISVMPLLQTAVFFAPDVSMESRSALLAQLRSTSLRSCEVEIKDGAKEEEMSRELLSPSDQVYSNGKFCRWEAKAGKSIASSDEILLEESSGESDESHSDSEVLTDY